MWADGSGTATAPSYTIASIVNAASNVAGAIAPNTIVTIYGSNLSYDTIASTTLSAGEMPFTLAGVTVFVGNVRANLFYVSPTQINLLVPNLLLPGALPLQVVRAGVAGPLVTVTLLETGPALFQLDVATIIATHLDGSVATPEAPASPGEIVVLYATGLGRTTPDRPSGQVPTLAAPIQHLLDFQVLLAGAAVDNGKILYAGTAPGFAGLYQINLRLPDDASADPDLQIAILDQLSPAALKLPLRAPRVQ
jgi:uncharacterized protein (TIGR03437 family)